ncbi:dihydrodipicolinate synthase family protein [Rhodopirellula sallentina]|uniref:Dihydrodipicolinate synthetase n=1 Tax=Rhodopirellula sallentina SM41 TaxID=1263870 RepID=M5UDG1_9BACT|nr:dihydrodipicolinate synthase family protein [Rhodopirellula sallentina]EMI55891.1 dihydrodipicolinate synthetase [Rhodopirellula sallentina SM41]
MLTPTLSLRGIVPPLITPLSDHDQLDHDGLQRLLTHVIEGGVSGVFLLGTTGEAPSLSYRLRRELIERSVRIIDGRIPILVGITDTAFVETVELARHAKECGAQALVLTTPYYFPAGQTELLGYVRKVVESVDLPVVLYNMPQLTKVWFEIDTLQRLAELDRVIGVKDSSGDLDYFKRLCELKSVRPDWSVLIGPEALLAEAHALGGDGGVNGGANVAPTLFVDCYRALQSGDEQEHARCQAKIHAFQSIYEIGKYASRHIKATKSAASLMGICSDLPALPFHRFLPPEREQVAAILRDLGLL